MIYLSPWILCRGKKYTKNKSYNVRTFIEDYKSVILFCLFRQSCHKCCIPPCCIWFGDFLMSQFVAQILLFYVQAILLIEIQWHSRQCTLLGIKSNKKLYIWQHNRFYIYINNDNVTGFLVVTWYTYIYTHSVYNFCNSYPQDSSLQRPSTENPLGVFMRFELCRSTLQTS